MSVGSKTTTILIHELSNIYLFYRFVAVVMFFFFFSSRRRHTRFDCDWSSDVCSSDLIKETDPARKIAMAEEFISKFPTSDLAATAQMIRFVSYSQLQKHKEAVAAGEQAIDATVKLGEKLVTKADADSKLTEKEKNDVKKKDKNAIFIDKNSPVFQQFM